MRRIIVVFLLAAFVVSSCGTTNKNCVGGKKIKSEMW